MEQAEDLDNQALRDEANAATQAATNIRVLMEGCAMTRRIEKILEQLQEKLEVEGYDADEIEQVRHHSYNMKPYGAPVCLVHMQNFNAPVAHHAAGAGGHGMKQVQNFTLGPVDVRTIEQNGRA